MENNIERETPRPLYSDRDIRCVVALVGDGSYLHRLAVAQSSALITELSNFLTTPRLTTVLAETFEERLRDTWDIAQDQQALQVVTTHLILLCERLSGEKLSFPEE